MSKLTALRHALSQPPSPHLSDELLAEIATAEAAGEDIQNFYGEPLAHLESCLQCSEAYGALLEMMLAAVQEMSEALWQPAETYTARLISQMTQQSPTQPDLATIVEQVLAHLPTHFADVPAEVTPEMLTPLVAQPTQATLIAQTINQNLAALATYLAGRAATVWQAALNAQTELSGRWSTIQLQLAAPQAIPVLSGSEIGSEKNLFSQRLGQPIPFLVNGHVEQISPLACRLRIRVDRPGLANASGRKVEIRYANQHQQTLTDHTGTAYFDSLPIAALASLTIMIDTGR